MRLLRSITQRGSDIRTAGWFTVLRRNSWFVASRFPDGFHRTGDPTRRISWSDSGPVTTPALSVNLTEQQTSPMRFSIAVVGALAITSAMLWWIMLP